MSVPTAAHVEKDLRRIGNAERAKNLAWFFKTGPGEYGAGDTFIGITVPEQRKIAKQYKNLPLPELKKLLQSPVHECRFTALEILVMQYEQNLAPQDKIFRFYLASTQYINNWDLVDTSAPYIIGDYVLHTSSKPLYALAKSKNVWERRIAIVATLMLLTHNRYTETVQLAKQYLNDSHDLIHKATGWALRELGKKDEHALKKFLDTHAHRMPRTILRYAIERLSPTTRQKYLAIKKQV